MLEIHPPNNGLIQYYVEPDSKRWAGRMEMLSKHYDLVVANLGKAFSGQSKYYNTHHRSVVFNVGDRIRQKICQLSSVARRVAAKLCRKYSIDVYTISKDISPLIYEVSNDNGVVVGRHHIKDLIEAVE